MPPVTYTTTYEQCPYDTYKNNCEYDCCITYQGGITEMLQICSPSLEEDVECVDSFEKVESVADSCVTDSAGNTCNEGCCMTVGTQATCVTGAYCNGYNLQAYTRGNIVNYANSIGLSITPSENTQNSSSTIGGIVTLGMVIFVLLIVIIITICAIIRTKSLNERVNPYEGSERKVASDTGKNLLLQPDPAMNGQI